MSTKTILVVDDNPDIVDYVCVLLEDNGYDTRQAFSSAAALDVLAGSPVDLAIIDVLMPGRSGLDLLKSIRSHPDLAELPVVVLTGNDQVVQAGARPYLGHLSGLRDADAILPKPLKPADLMQTLEKLGVCPT